MKRMVIPLIVTVILCVAGYAYAQTAATPPAAPKAASNAANSKVAGAKTSASAPAPQGKLVLNTLPFEESLLFNPLEIRSILTAGSGGRHGNIPNTGEVTNISLHRTITLAGVLYRKPGDWVVWLNGSKVTPSQWLPEIIDISVQNDQVMLQWFDIGMAKIISITLRPRQTYDIVTGLLLPG